MARLWLHGPGLVPGMRDMRLPGAEDAVRHFRSLGYEVHLRSSGGRLVVLDEGVLNVAIAYAGEDLPGIEPGFQLMAGVLATALGDLGLDPAVGEVAGSICAGRYDLAVAGRKVAGLSQRRRRNFALIHAFLLVEGDGSSREDIAASFYRLAGASPEEGIRRGTMAALRELRHDVTLAMAADALMQVLTRL
jgi:octanoyl-[GcvH]:protein N-octanoyltransferase